jgi:phosphotriesterase-related protein
MIRTVLGDIDGGSLGPTDYHEHAFQVTPLLPGDELDDEAKSEQDLRELRDSGFSAMIDATPTGLGRRPRALAAISARTGLSIVATTGAHRDEHYASGHWIRRASESELAAEFTRDIEQGMPDEDNLSAPAGPVGDAEQGPRAGLLKAGIGYWRISRNERRVLAAVATAHHKTGAPIMVHLEAGTAAFEVLEFLSGLGVDADSVALAHIDRNPDAGLHADLAATGAYLGYDGFARAKDWPDSIVIECLLQSADSGAAERILIGGDVARRARYRGYGGMPGLRYLGSRVVPRLRARASDALLELILIINPARFLDRFPAEAQREGPSERGTTDPGRN